MAIRYIHDRFLMGDHSYICLPYYINGGISAIHVGKYCSIAQGCIIDCGFGHDYKNVTTFPMHILKENVPQNLYSKGDIILFNDIWVGNQVTLMSGITIGNGAVIGANATVRRNILPYEIYTGSKTPEKYRFSPEIISKLLEIAWWDWSDEKVLANCELLVDKDINNFINNHI